MHRLALLVLIAGLILGCSPTEKPDANVGQPATTGGMAGGGKSGPEEISEGPPAEQLPAILDLPLYPGAKLVSSKVASSGQDKRYRVTLETADGVEKVAAFYKKNGIDAIAKGDKAQAMGSTRKGNLVIIEAERKGEKTELLIRVSPAAGG